MEEPIENNTQEREDDLLTEQQDIFSYYRRLRSNLFSDTEVVYETKLTPELFDLKLQQLSQDKKQSEFENFVLVLAARLVTPNIKPQPALMVVVMVRWMARHILLTKQYLTGGGCLKEVLVTKNGR